MERGQIYASHLLADEEMLPLLKAEDLGVESIEFGIPDSLDRLEQTIREYRLRMTAMGAQRLTIHGPFLDLNPASYDSMVRRATMERFAAAYGAAEKLGADKIVFHSCIIPTVHYTQGWPEQMAGFFREFMEGRETIPVVIENVLDPDPDLLVRVMELTEIPNLRLCLDLGHAHCYSKIPVEEWCRKLVPWLSHVHIHDNAGDKDSHLGTGLGTIPWDEIAVILREVPELTATIECNNSEEIHRSLEWLLSM